MCALVSCPPVSLRLLDAARGLVAYLLAGKLRLLRLSDGRTITLAKATDGRFGDRGLVYAYQATGAWPGRIHFISWARLPLHASR